MDRMELMKVGPNGRALGMYPREDGGMDLGFEIRENGRVIASGTISLTRDEFYQARGFMNDIK